VSVCNSCVYVYILLLFVSFVWVPRKKLSAENEGFVVVVVFSGEEVLRILRNAILTMKIPDGVTFHKNGVWQCHEHREKAKEISYLQACVIRFDPVPLT
jgi:hypothetical protein